MPRLTTSLFRAIPKGTFTDNVFVVDDEPVDGLLYPRFHDSTYEDAKGETRTSSADLTVTENAEGVEIAQDDGGTSMFDVDGWFGFSTWDYFEVPEGTEYGECLHINRGKSRRKNRAGDRRGRHYQIEPKNPMTVDALKGALDNFARAAVARQVALAAAK